ncbi:caspase family protein [Romeriopsis navalis]|nr:caspase family protein [Romeriopsis navalis]
MKRRHFLQAAGSTLAALGLSQADFLLQADRYSQVLAKGKPGRKLALLVGINRYPRKVGKLRGCLTDVELQWELLVNRYGFNPKDILVLADRRLSFLDYVPDQPTRENILSAYESHLIRQADADTTAVFHFSGHGALVKDPNPLPELIKNVNGVKTVAKNPDGVTGSILPLDRLTGYADEVDDITGRTLYLLTALLAQKTPNITTVLDSCHSGGGFRGNAMVRAVNRPDGGFYDSSEAEIDYQKSLLRKLKLDEVGFQALRQKGIAAGVAIGSANYNELAADAPIWSPNGKFYAGALTYTLTRYLWQQPVNESLDRVFVNISRKARDIGSSAKVIQEPLYQTSNDKHYPQQPIYLSNPANAYADAAVRKVSKEGQIHYWMGGLASSSLDQSIKGTIFSAIDAAGQEVGQIEHQGRGARLVGYGRLVKGAKQAIKPGVLLREKVRGLPTDVKLKVALDESLGVDLTVAREVLQEMRGVEVVEADQPVAFQIARMNDRYQSRAGVDTHGVKDLEQHTVGLVEGELQPLVPTFGMPNEPIEDAMDRLRSKLQSFRAREILKAMGGVDVASGNQRGTLQVSAEASAKSPQGKVGDSKFVSGSRINLVIENTGRQDVYVGVVAIGSAGNLRVLYPYFGAGSIAEEKARVAAGRKLVLPEDGVEFPLGAPGTLEILTFSSHKPINKALTALQSIASSGRGGVPSRGGEIPADPLMGDDAIDSMSALLGDVDQNSRSEILVRRTVKAVDTSLFSVVPTLIEVVAGK